MSLNKLNLSAICDHNYCPHQHYKKCRKQRQRNIPYTYRPNHKIDTTCNIHPKALGNLTTRNIPTLAFEKYIANPVLPDQEDNNFGRNYYLENCPENYQLNNNILAQAETQMAENNAYVLAKGATEDYNKFAKKRQEYLDNARRRANVAFNQYYFNIKTARQARKAEQARWVTEYYRKVQELIDNIFNKKSDADVDDAAIKEKMFIREQSGNNPKHLATVKVKDKTAALNILQSLRAVLLRKKMDLQQVRKDQEHNKSVTVSYMDSSNTSQNVSSASFMSATTNATKQQKEADFAEQFCNFQALKKKWGKQNVEEVRNILRTMLCRNLINKAEGQEMRERKKAKEKDEYLKKQMQKMGKLKGNKVQGKNKKLDTKSNKDKSVVSSKQLQKPEVIIKQKLTKQEQAVKSTLIKGGIFDSMGTRYERNRNYGSLFKKRKDQSLLELSFNENLWDTGLATDRKIR